MIIAIDGTSASGKGTLARRLATHFDYAYLETGMLYRAVAFLMLEETEGEMNKDVAIEIATTFTPDDLKVLEHNKLRLPRVSTVASEISAMPEIREALLVFQKRFVKRPPEKKKGAVLDGRDIGTVICPNAKVKFFLDADLEVRAQRRTAELEAQGDLVKPSEVFERLKNRDQLDSSRADSPLTKAKDAFEINTTSISEDEVFEKALKYIEEK